MIPGIGGMAKEAQAAVDRGDLRRTEAIIRAMTPRERRDPTILNASRRRRIAAGAGTVLPEVNRLVKQYDEMRKMMKQLSGLQRRGGAAGLLADAEPQGEPMTDQTDAGLTPQADENVNAVPATPVAPTPAAAEAASAVRPPARPDRASPRRPPRGASGALPRRRPAGRPRVGSTSPRRPSNLPPQPPGRGVASAGSSPRSSSSSSRRVPRPPSSSSPARPRPRPSPAGLPRTRSSTCEARFDLPGDQRDKARPVPLGVPGLRRPGQPRCQARRGL